jgi:hypothetical protein
MFNFANVKRSSVLPIQCSQRIWRYIYLSNGTLPFEQGRILCSLLSGVQDEGEKIYFLKLKKLWFTVFCREKFNKDTFGTHELENNPRPAEKSFRVHQNINTSSYEVAVFCD